MSTPKLAIARGYTRLPASAAVTGHELAPSSPEYRWVHDRLSALERLARLFERGMLSDEEFAAEKARILGRSVEQPGLDAPAHIRVESELRVEQRRGPSLLGRLLSWKAIPVGLAAGLVLSVVGQPRETIRFFEDAVRLLGA